MESRMQAMVWLVVLACRTGYVIARDNYYCTHPAKGCSPARTLTLATICRGRSATRGVFGLNAWLSMSCDYVVFNYPAKQKSNKYIITPHGDCDGWSAEMGEWLAGSLDYNRMGLRQCQGLDWTDYAFPGTCLFNRSRCDALHVSWTDPVTPGSLADYWGPGFNPPALVQASRNESNQLLFWHEYDGMPDYVWAKQCNATAPAYICITGSLDPNFDKKFYGTQGIKAILEQGLSNSKYVDCKVEVVDARNSTKVPGWVPGMGYGNITKINRFVDKPCSGTYPNIGVGPWTWEIPGHVATALQIPVLLEGKKKVVTGELLAIRTAVALALKSPEEM